MKNWIKFGGLLIGIGIFIIIVSSVLRSCGNTTDTIHKEYSTSALLKKYNDFKDLASAIDNKKAGIVAYENEIKTLDKSDKVEYNQMRAELRGMVMIYNNLVAQYNSNMSKANYAFTNAGQMPASNLTPLPREYREYQTNF